jgi:enoyl-[acyl-carrier protein] reductase I
MNPDARRRGASFLSTCSIILTLARPKSGVRYIAAELGPKGIHVHAISPRDRSRRASSGIPVDDLLDKAKAKAAGAQPGQHRQRGDRHGASHDAARPITGHSFYIDGG